MAGIPARWDPRIYPRVLMAKKDGKDPTVWMRAIKPHTYENKPKDVGEIYLAHADMVETIERVLQFAVRDTPPPRAERPADPVPSALPRPTRPRPFSDD